MTCCKIPTCRTVKEEEQILTLWQFLLCFCHIKSAQFNNSTVHLFKWKEQCYCCDLSVYTQYRGGSRRQRTHHHLQIIVQHWTVIPDRKQGKGALNPPLSSEAHRYVPQRKTYINTVTESTVKLFKDANLAVWQMFWMVSQTTTFVFVLDTVTWQIWKPKHSLSPVPLSSVTAATPPPFRPRILCSGWHIYHSARIHTPFIVSVKTAGLPLLAGYIKEDLHFGQIDPVNYNYGSWVDLTCRLQPVKEYVSTLNQPHVSSFQCGTWSLHTVALWWKWTGKKNP